MAGWWGPTRYEPDSPPPRPRGEPPRALRDSLPAGSPLSTVQPPPGLCLPPCSQCLRAWTGHSARVASPCGLACPGPAGLQTAALLGRPPALSSGPRGAAPSRARLAPLPWPSRTVSGVTVLLSPALWPVSFSSCASCLLSRALWIVPVGGLTLAGMAWRALLSAESLLMLARASHPFWHRECLDGKGLLKRGLLSSPPSF